MIANTSAATKTTEPDAVRRSHVWAWLASALAIVLVLADWAFTIYMSVIAHAGTCVPPPANDLEWFSCNVLWGVLFPLSWLSFAIVGTIILSRRPDNKIGWLCLALAAFGALEDLPWRLATMVASPVMAGVLSLIAFVFYPLYLPMTQTLLLLHFPTGRYLSHPWRSAGIVAIGCAAVSTFAAIIRPEAWVGQTGEVPNPVFLLPADLAPFISQFSWMLIQFAQRVGWIALGAAVVSLVVRWRSTSTDAVQRQQLKWLTLACMISIVFLVLGFATNQLTPFTLAMSTLALLGFGIGVPVAIGIAILRHGLFDIDVVINRALVYGTLTVMVAGIYALGVGAAGRLFQSQTGLAIPALALAGAVAIALTLRRRIQQGVDRLLSLPERGMQQSTSHASDTRLSGAPLVIARVALLLLAAMVGVIFVTLFPINWSDAITEWQVAMGAAALPYVGSLTFARYVVVLRYLAASVFFVTAFVIVRRKSDDWLALLAAGVLVALPVALDLGGYTETWYLYPALWSEPLRHMNDSITFTSSTLLILLAFLFPNGRFAPRWMRWVILLPLAMTGPIFIETVVGESAIPAPLRELPWLAWTSTLMFGLLAAAGGQIYRYRHLSTPVQRQQTKLVVFGLACIPVMFLLTTVVGGQWQGTRYVPIFQLVNIHIVLVVFTLLPITLGISILRYRLWDIAPIVMRTLIYGLLVAIVVILYVLIVGGLSTVFQSSGDLLVAVIATGLIAVLFNPLRTRVQRVVNRALYGERDDPTTVLSRLGQQLESATMPYTALKSIVDSVAQALKLPYAEIALKDGDTFKTVAIFDRVTRGRGRGGVSPDRLVPLSLIHQGETVGEMRVAPRTPGEVFSSQDMALLKNIAHQAGATAHAALLMRDLQHSRESLVTAREEERRRLRRDLHDGLGPTLASQTLKLDAAMDLMEANPHAARELLNQLKRQTQTTVADVRRLVYELRPPALDEQGLVGAIRNFASAINGLDVTVDAPDAMPPLSAAVEVAAYRIVTEAITNVIKHAKARRCNVTIRVLNEVLKDVETHPSTGTGDVSLQITIADDGIGIAPSHTSGVGLRSMRERAEELGGALAIESSGQGVTITAELPIERPI